MKAHFHTVLALLVVFSLSSPSLYAQYPAQMPAYGYGAPGMVPVGQPMFAPPGMAQFQGLPAGYRPSPAFAPPSQVIPAGAAMTRKGYSDGGGKGNGKTCGGKQSSCGGKGCNSANCGPRWSFSADALYMTRNSDSAIPLLMNSPGFPIGNATIFNSGDLRVDWELAPRVSIIRHGILDTKTDLEITYFQIDTFQADAVVGVAGDGMAFDRIISPVGTAGPTSLTLGSDISNGEVNLRPCLNDRFTLLAGFRWIELDEAYFAQDSVNGNVYTSDTNNHLYGGQVGVDMLAVGDEQGSIHLVTKAGVFGNVADQTSHQNYTTFFSGTTGAREFQTSVLWEAAVNCRIRLARALELQAGYQVMWLNGLALAAEQSLHNDFANAYGGTLVNTGGSLLYHGGFVGLTGSF